MPRWSMSQARCWEENALALRPLLEDLLKIAERERVRLAIEPTHAPRAVNYEDWYDIELIGPEIEAEGCECVVPRSIRAFEQLWH